MSREPAVAPVRLGRYLSYWFERSPRRALHYAAYYTFAARLIGSGRRVLDLGCSEGLGTWILARHCGEARGVDLDREALEAARANWTGPSIAFLEADLLGLEAEPWDAVVSFDTVEHIDPARAEDFFRTLGASLAPGGVAVVGTPSLEGQAFASAVSRAGHINLYDFERLEASMARQFRHVFMFCANDEVVHTGYPRLAHYLIAVGCVPA